MGVVQGVGFRPFVYKRACQFDLAGWVANTPLGITIEIEGTPQQVGRFLNRFADSIPSRASIVSQQLADLPALGDSTFQIRDSLQQAPHAATVSPDIATCDECQAELFDESDRRFRYPFINCTQCGPRFTIVRNLPYDRQATTMDAFEMCAPCRREFQADRDRRFHAQPNACWQCGPSVEFLSNLDKVEASHEGEPGRFVGQRAIEACLASIKQGLIVAVKGIGGFHLVCDATNAESVARLRTRKKRIAKPFAIMVRDLDSAKSLADLNAVEARQLESVARPIVVLKQRAATTLGRIADSVAPDQSNVGVMLPYSPIHRMLVESSAPLVMTSGNLCNEPIARTNEEALTRLDSVADAFLLHDREIQVACDDSVVRVVANRPVPIRRSRGYVPLPIPLRRSGPDVLAIGGDLKSTMCLTKGDIAFLGPHVGDQESLDSRQAMKRCVEHFLRLYQVKPEAIVADLHPDYHSRRLAESLARQWSIPLLLAQHHEAHLASLIAESDRSGDETILGCCFDGTGLGHDNSIWGGEFILKNCDGFARVAHLRTVPLPGGDACIRKPYRTALSYLWSADLAWASDLACVQASPASERTLLKQQLERGFNCPQTSSMGRLIDAVASLIGLRQLTSYEGEAAMVLESAAQRIADEDNGSPYEFELKESSHLEINPGPVLAAIIGDLKDQVAANRISYRFHCSVVEMIVGVCEYLRNKWAVETVGLTGGVFQNAFLLEQCCKRLNDSGFRVLTHSVVPANDGGLALGQAEIGRELLNRTSTSQR